SSRRRHTRFSRDWSSDVCSSDLMQDLMLVGCSSIALWDDFTEDGELLIGRNFDFYVNDAFAENKIVEFIQPKTGYNYASVTWPRSEERRVGKECRSRGSTRDVK